MTWIDRQDPEKVERALGALRAQRPDYIRDEANGDERFALWLVNVDARMARMVGVGHGDIADWQWWESYEAGDSPRAAAVEALEADDLPWPVGGE